MIDPRVASGLRDILPSVMIPRERMLASFRQTFASFGYLPIETPHIERMDVLTGKGAGSDEVLRQIFEVTNKGGTPGELALRFDLTVPLARFVAKHVNELGTPFKRYAIGSVFRGERPAKGRFREFMQCDFDTVGTESAVADAETAQVIYEALTAAGVPKFTITLNNRKVLNGLFEFLSLQDRTVQILRIIDKREKMGDDGMKSALLALLPSPGHQTITARIADKIIDFTQPYRKKPQSSGDPSDPLGSYLSYGDLDLAQNLLYQQGYSDLLTASKLLIASGVPTDCVTIDRGLARGLDYYTGVVFETTVDGWEHFGSIASGGRYDNLASLFTDRKLPGVGASIGLDRLLALMQEAGWLKGTSSTAPVLVANFAGSDPTVPVKLAAALRAAGIGAEVFPDAIQIGKQMGYGSARGHKLAVIVGPDEVGREVFNLRDLTTRQEQRAILWADLVSTVEAALGG